MSKKLISMVLAGILLITFGYLAGTFSINPVYANKNIEYKVVRYELENLQPILSKMAADGWEYHSNIESNMIFKK
jgi:peptidoglycan hydrolase CwlO-like protein